MRKTQNDVRNLQSRGARVNGEMGQVNRRIAEGIMKLEEETVR